MSVENSTTVGEEAVLRSARRYYGLLSNAIHTMTVKRVFCLVINGTTNGQTVLRAVKRHYHRFRFVKRYDGLSKAAFRSVTVYYVRSKAVLRSVKGDIPIGQERFYSRSSGSTVGQKGTSVGQKRYIGRSRVKFGTTVGQMRCFGRSSGTTVDQKRSYGQ